VLRIADAGAVKVLRIVIVNLGFGELRRDAGLKSRKVDGDEAGKS
jgi:hypothetical protein